MARDDDTVLDRPIPAPPVWADALGAAMADSRERWRDLALLMADFAFETDARGVFAFVAPAMVFGWPAAALIDRRPASFLVPDATGTVAPDTDPFRPAEPVREHLLWFRAADGSARRLRFCATPVGSGPTPRGARGLAIDITEQEQATQSLARHLRVASAMRHVFDRLREETSAARMVQTVLDAVRQVAGADGAALLMSDDDVAPTPRIVVGLPADRAPPDPADDPRLIRHPCHARLPHRIEAVFWRAAGQRSWSAEERHVLAECTAILEQVIEQDVAHSEMSRQARTDPLTGLLNRRAFVAEIERHIDRLDRERAPGTLICIDLDHFKSVNDGFGHAAGDRALIELAEALRTVIRPSDLAARLGGDEFAVWLSGADHLAAAERAEQLRRLIPNILASTGHPDLPWLTISQGIACRWPGGGETLEGLFQRADAALYAVKRNGRAHWLVAPHPPLPGAPQPAVP